MEKRISEDVLKLATRDGISCSNVWDIVNKTLFSTCPHCRCKLPACARSVVQIAEALDQLGTAESLAAAVEFYEEALKQDPGDTIAMSKFATLYERLGNQEAADKIDDMVVSITGATDTETLMCQANILLRKCGNVESAAEYTEKLKEGAYMEKLKEGMRCDPNEADFQLKYAMAIGGGRLSSQISASDDCEMQRIYCKIVNVMDTDNDTLAEAHYQLGLIHTRKASVSGSNHGQEEFFREAMKLGTPHVRDIIIHHAHL
jgi:tetratricopeptide (TPR) repeat protein